MKSLFLILFLPFVNLAQLPTQSVIRENGIVQMVVWNHELPPYVKGYIDIDLLSRKREIKTDTTVTLQMTWFFDEFGKPIKNRSTHNATEYVGRFAYDDQNRLVEKTYYRNGIETFRELVNQLADSTIEFKRWKDGELFEHSLGASDSTHLYSYPIQKGHLPYYIFNPDSNYWQVAIYDNGKLKSLRKEKWVLGSNGKPVALEVDFQQFQRVSKRNMREKSYHETFPVDSTGRILATSKHRAPRPFFYLQHRKLSFISNYDIQNFNVDELKDRTEDVRVMTYDVIDPRYFLSFDYYTFSTDL